MKLLAVLIALVSALHAFKLVGDYRSNFELSNQAPDQQEMATKLADMLVTLCVKTNMYPDDDIPTPFGASIWILTCSRESSMTSTIYVDGYAWKKFNVIGILECHGAQYAFKFSAIFQRTGPDTEIQQFTLSKGKLNFQHLLKHQGIHILD